MDIKTLEREMTTGKETYRKLKDKETSLTRDLATKRAQNMKYSEDSQRAAAAAKKYAEDLARVEGEREKIETDLKETQKEILTYTKTVKDLQIKFEDMSRELERQSRNVANSNSAPTQRRSGGIFG